MTAVAELTDLSKTPGAMERTLRRELPDGSLIDFEEAPKGWLKKDGQPRARDHRAYHFTPAGERRARFPSTSTLLEETFPKPGVAPWSEKRGIEGLLLAIQDGAIDPQRVTVEQAIESVKRLKLGADAAKRRAADRGLNVHAINEHYMETGEGPKLKDHPEHHRGYIKSWAKCMLALRLEPVEVEQLVVHPEDGYAGRLDLRAIVGGLLETIDFKTQENGGIYPGAHYQVNLYERGAVRCGAEPASHRRVIVLSADGDWSVERDSMIADHEDWRIDAMLAHYRGQKPITALCNSRNEAQKAARS